MPTLRRRTVSVALAVIALVAVVAVAVVGSPSGGRTIEAATGGSFDGSFDGSFGEYHAVTPTRVLDTRRKPPLDVEPFGPKQTGTSPSVVFDVPLLGPGSPLGEFQDLDSDGYDDNVLAVVANVTVVAPTGAGHLTMFPKGSTEGETSVVNYKPGQTVANTAILRPGLGGEVSVHLVTPFAPGTAHLILDISGWFSTDAYGERGARVVTREPTRIYDSNVVLGGKQLTGPTSVDIPIWGATDLDTGTIQVVPDSPDVVGVIVNLTGVDRFPGSRPTHFSLVPDPIDVSDPGQWPTTSNLNLVPGQTRANLAIVPIDPDDGSIRLFILAGETRAVVDVVGYLLDEPDATTRAGRVVPLVAPFRAFDTRRDEFYAQPLSPAFAETWSFDAFVNDVKVGGVAVGPDQSGLFGNLTAVGLERQYAWAPVRTYMTAYPANDPGVDECKPPPNVSNVNLGEGEAVPNLALLTYGGSVDTPHRVCVFNLAGYVDYLFDVYAIVLG